MVVQWGYGILVYTCIRYLMIVSAARKDQTDAEKVFPRCCT